MSRSKLDRARHLAAILLATSIAGCSPHAAPPPGRASASTASSSATANIAASPRFPLPARLPARYLRTLAHDPGGYDAVSPPGGPSRAHVTDLLLGDLLFHSPSTLGPRAREHGLSCQSCHPNGAAHTTFAIEGFTDRPGHVDVSTGNFRAAADDGITNPISIPSLRGARFTGPYGHDGRTASLAEMVQTVVTSEFDGVPLSLRKLAALVRYVQDLDFLPNSNLDARSALTSVASPAAQRGQALFRRPTAAFDGGSCASCHHPSTFFRDGGVHRLGSGTLPSPHAVDNGIETPTLLGTVETAPYFHDGRFATLADVVAWFDSSYALQLSDTEQADLTAYLKAVGAVDRPHDTRPLGRRLSHTFAYIALVADADVDVRRAAIDAVVVELNNLLSTVDLPMRAATISVLANRAATLRTRVAALPVTSGPIASHETRALRRDLTHFAADWAGAL